MTRRAAVDDVAEHNRQMWERLARADIPYTRPQGTPPRDRRGKRAFVDGITHGLLRGVDLEGKRVLSLAGGGGWDAVLFAELGAPTTLFDLSAAQLATVRRLARERGTRLRLVRGDMRDLSAFEAGSFDVVYHHHSLVFVPDAKPVIGEVARVLAPDGIYAFSTMHPVTLRMYETWTGTGWGFKQRYFQDGAIPLADATWKFGDVKVDAPTLEYGHRVSDLMNACVRRGLSIERVWEWSPSYAGGPAGSDDALERALPAFLAIRARRRRVRDAAPKRSTRRTAR